MVAGGGGPPCDGGGVVPGRRLDPPRARGAQVSPHSEIVLYVFSKSCRVGLFRRAEFYKAKPGVAALMKEQT